MSTTPTLDRPAPSEPPPPSRRWLRVAALVVLIALAVVVVWLVVVGLLLGDDAGSNVPAVDANPDPGTEDPVDEGSDEGPTSDEPPPADPTPDAGDGADALPGPVADMAAEIEQAIQAEDWEDLAELALADGAPFTATFGQELTTVDELAAYWRELATEEDLPRIVTALLTLPDWSEQPGTDADGAELVLHVTPRFMHEPDADARAELEAALGETWVEAQMASGQYLGWRVGITADGDWRFLVQGD